MFKLNEKKMSLFLLRTETMLLVLVINFKKTTIVGILKFMTGQIVGILKFKTRTNCWHFKMYDQDKLLAF